LVEIFPRSSPRLPAESVSDPAISCCPPLSVQMTASFRMPISGM